MRIGSVVVCGIGVITNEGDDLSADGTSSSAGVGCTSTKTRDRRRRPAMETVSSYPARRREASVAERA